MSFRSSSAGATDAGKVRSVNEDAYLDLSEHGIWLVADGMGGHSDGAQASNTIIEAFQHFPSCKSLEQKIDMACRSIYRAHRAVLKASGEMGEDVVMGSTIVMLVIAGGEFAVLWAGDSRLYRYRGGAMEQVTRDHSVVQEMIEEGTLKPEDRESHPLANQITRAVGASEEIVLDQIRGRLMDGDVFLLCTDGLTREVPETIIQRTIASSDCDQSVDQLLRLALSGYARDNITIQVIEVEETTAIVEEDEDDTAVNYSLQSRTVTLNGVGNVDNDS